jgi:anti-sigma B factor antagonist
MEITHESVGSVNVLHLVGHLNDHSAEDAHETIMSVLLTGQPILLNFSEVSEVTDAGLRTMLVIYRQAQAIDCRVSVVGLSSELHSALRATGFLRFFLVADDVAVGLAALQQSEDERSAVV